MSQTRPPAFDDRFTTPIEASRRGAHRARPKPVSTGLPIVAGIAVVLLVVGGVYAVVGGHKNDTNSKSSLAAASALNNDPDVTATGKAKATAQASATQSAQAPATSTDGDPSASTSTGDTNAGGTVNRNVELVILNSVSVHGLAAKVQSSVESDGWTVTRTGNSRQRNLSTTKIYYGKSSTKDTATGLQKDLGFGNTIFDSSVVSTALKGSSGGVVVVLGQDSE
jgi:hypothetical protein